MFQRLGIVHADMKPENIIIEYDADFQEIKSLKIIDFGSAFLLNSTATNQMEFNASTPEYVPPEVHAYLTKKNNIRISDFHSISYVFDMWALASILLEVLSGFPLWLSLKSRIVTKKNKGIFGVGLFGVACRDNGKILDKQMKLLKGTDLRALISTLKQGFDVDKQNEWLCNNEFMDLYR